MQNEASIKRNLGQKIKNLAEQGLSYRKIQKKLGCSKGAIAYHLGKGQKKKALARQAKYKASFQMDRDKYLAQFNQSSLLAAAATAAKQCCNGLSQNFFSGLCNLGDRGDNSISFEAVQEAHKLCQSYDLLRIINLKIIDNTSVS